MIILAVEDAQAVLSAIGRKKRQVLVRFRLVEMTKSRLQNLGIDLEKAAGKSRLRVR